MPGKIVKFPPDPERAVEIYGNSLYRLCSVMTGNKEDAQDAVQECFLRYITKAPDFRDEEYCKQYENDRLTPFYGSDGSEPNIPCCSHHDYRPSEEQLKNYHEAIKQ